ncbi:MAG: 3-hydroxyacyl-ACP dehydratase FabZ family protein, partial [Owenweeksia sp.]
MKEFSHILDQLPYAQPFRFVDKLDKVDTEGASGSYTFPENSDFYRGHFKDHPVTPGVILTECMAQIGLVCLGSYLLEMAGKNQSALKIAFTESHVHFEKPVFPGETVFVRSEKIYWRMGKLKCRVYMHNSNGERVCHGEMS